MNERAVDSFSAVAVFPVLADAVVSSPCEVVVSLAGRNWSVLKSFESVGFWPMTLVDLGNQVIAANGRVGHCVRRW
jgi:hypothetical protein